MILSNGVSPFACRLWHLQLLKASMGQQHHWPRADNLIRSTLNS
jgi:hypothetical protein